jgi:hypothetical protein
MARPPAVLQVVTFVVLFVWLATFGVWSTIVGWATMCLFRPTAVGLLSGVGSQPRYSGLISVAGFVAWAVWLWTLVLLRAD